MTERHIACRFLVLITLPLLIWTSDSSAISLTSFVYPVSYPRLSSHYGNRNHPIFKKSIHHGGVDLAAPSGAPIRSVAAGTVFYADPHGGYGNFISVRHKHSYSSHYGHCESIKVKPGQKVVSGQIIGTVGSTGNSTGPHLHFELRKNGDKLNPEEYMPLLAGKAEG